MPERARGRARAFDAWTRGAAALLAVFYALAAGAPFFAPYTADRMDRDISTIRRSRFTGATAPARFTCARSCAARAGGLHGVGLSRGSRLAGADRVLGSRRALHAPAGSLGRPASVRRARGSRVSARRRRVRPRCLVTPGDRLARFAGRGPGGHRGLVRARLAAGGPGRLPGRLDRYRADARVRTAAQPARPVPGDRAAHRVSARAFGRSRVSDDRGHPGGARLGRAGPRDSRSGAVRSVRSITCWPPKPWAPGVFACWCATFSPTRSPT